MTKIYQKVFSAILVILLTLLVPLGIYSNWVVSTVKNQDQFINSFTQLSNNSSIKELLTTSITLYVDEIEIANAIKENVPSSLASFTEAAEKSVRNLLKDLITEIIDGPRYEIIWAEVSRSLHVEIMSVLEDEANGFLRVKPGGLFITSEPIKERLLLQLASNPQLFFILANFTAAEAPKIQIIGASELERIVFVWKLSKFFNDYAWLLLLIFLLLLLTFQKSILQSGLLSGIAIFIGGLISLFLSLFLNVFFQRKINDTFAEEVISALILNGSKAVLPSIYLVIAVGILIILGFSIVRFVKLKKFSSL